MLKSQDTRLTLCDFPGSTHNIYRAIGYALAFLLGVSGCNSVITEGPTNLSGRAAEVFSDPSALALAKAAENGDLTKLDRLLKKGVNVNSVGKFGVTPLWWAIRTRNKWAYLDIVDTNSGGFDV